MLTIFKLLFQLDVAKYYCKVKNNRKIHQSSNSPCLPPPSHLVFVQLPLPLPLPLSPSSPCLPPPPSPLSPSSLSPCVHAASAASAGRPSRAAPASSPPAQPLAARACCAAHGSTLSASPSLHTSHNSKHKLYILQQQCKMYLQLQFHSLWARVLIWSYYLECFFRLCHDREDYKTSYMWYWPKTTNFTQDH